MSLDRPGRMVLDGIMHSHDYLYRYGHDVGMNKDTDMAFLQSCRAARGPS